MIQFSMIPRANNLVDCELWVEPQIGEVRGTEDLKICKQCRAIHEDDTDVVCCDEQSLSDCNLEQFYYYLADWFSESQTGIASVISTFDLIWNMLTTSKNNQKVQAEMERQLGNLQIMSDISLQTDSMMMQSSNLSNVSDYCETEHQAFIQCTRTDGNAGTPRVTPVPFDVISLITDPTVGHACFDYGLLHHTFADLQSRTNAKFQLHDMLAMALRRINLCEIHSGRVFASMLSEKRILFLVLPPFEDASLDPKLEELDSFLLRLEQAQVQDDSDVFEGELEGLRPKRSALDDKLTRATQLHAFEVSRREVLFSTKSDINKIEHRLKRQDLIIKRVLKMINNDQSESIEGD